MGFSELVNLVTTTISNIPMSDIGAIIFVLVVFVLIIATPIMLIRALIKLVKRSNRRAKFESEIRKALSDNILENSEIENLYIIGKNLGLTEEYMLSRVRKVVASKFNNWVEEKIFKSEQILEDGLSDNDIENIRRKAENLNVGDVDDVISAILNTDYVKDLRNIYLLENNMIDKMVELEPEINLNKGEKLYHKTPASWNQLRKKTDTYGFGGITTAIPIAKGVKIRLGAIKPVKFTSENLSEIDSGILYITNKRLVFVGSKRNTNIAYGRILQINALVGGIEVSKSTGKNDVFEFNNRIATKLAVDFIQNLLRV